MTNRDREVLVISIVAFIFLFGMMWGIYNNNKQRDNRQKEIIERYRAKHSIPINPEIEKMPLMDQYFYYRLKAKAMENSCN